MNSNTFWVLLTGKGIPPLCIRSEIPSYVWHSYELINLWGKTWWGWGKIWWEYTIFYPKPDISLKLMFSCQISLVYCNNEKVGFNVCSQHSLNLCQLANRISLKCLFMNSEKHPVFCCVTIHFPVDPRGFYIFLFSLRRKRMEHFILQFLWIIYIQNHQIWRCLILNGQEGYEQLLS